MLGISELQFLQILFSPPCAKNHMVFCKNALAISSPNPEVAPLTKMCAISIL